MNKILPGLYLGSYNDAKDYAQLQENNITCIVSLMRVKRRIFPNIEYLCIRARDEINQNVMQFFGICNQFIHQARLANQNVLVHCAAGKSRSVTIIAAYLMALTNINYHDALYFIKSRRSCASPNPSFQLQLHLYDKSLKLHRFQVLSRKVLKHTFMHPNDLKSVSILLANRIWVRRAQHALYNYIEQLL